ncbi:MAG: hypothetical protein KKA79_01180 [Nanoarchaeota archaeon]|nr:hypothetical protein [Nanoarchaeota archaeon]MCG2717648.1 hypothetical protein [Nanoarchaeota archaeon]
MKIPTTFRAKKDLGEKMNQLVEKANIFEERPIIKSSDVNEILNTMYLGRANYDNIDLHERLCNLLKNTDYENISDEPYDYWYKPGKLGLDLFITKKCHSDNYGDNWEYEFTTLKPENLDKFRKRVKRYDKIYDFCNNKHVRRYSLIGTAVTAIPGGGYSVYQALDCLLNNPHWVFDGLGITLGLFVGSFVTTFLADYGLYHDIPEWYNLNRIRSLTSDIYTEDEAVKEAFGRI